MRVGTEIGYETYLFKIRQMLKGATSDIYKMLARGTGFFAVGLLGDLGIEEHICFEDFKAARDYYLFVDRGYKALYEFEPDGTRKRMTKEDMIRKPFDYAAPVKDIRRVPCKRLKVFDTEAYAHFTDSVYCYRYDEKRKVWKLAEIRKEWE